MEAKRREQLRIELTELTDRMKGGLVDPKDMRRKEEITSILLTDGESNNIQFKFVRGRGGKMGRNTKGYYNKGPVGK